MRQNPEVLWHFQAISGVFFRVSETFWQDFPTVFQCLACGGAMVMRGIAQILFTVPLPIFPQSTL
jgi:hypothetical protein